jgi:ATP-dependent NAD(P)H-hydrate dehydratase
MEGSNRRCGGQGDMLCGTLGTFTFWTDRATTTLETDINPNMLAAYAAAALVKTCNTNAFAQMHRSMLTTVSNLYGKENRQRINKLFLRF